MRRVGVEGKVRVREKMLARMALAKARTKSKKVRDYKTLTELAVECGITRQALNVRLYARGIPFEKIGSGKQPTIVVRKKYWEALKKKRPTWF
jgi:Zn-dependent peptidase ImmA (M78 family)